MFPEEMKSDEYVEFYDIAYSEYTEDQMLEIRKFLKDKPMDNPRFEFTLDDTLPF